MNKEIILRLYVLLLLIGLPLIICAQQRQVKVSLMKGTVLEGNLVEFKAFDHLVMEVKGQRVFIDYKDMAYIDDISQAKEDQQQDLAPVEAVVAVEAVKPAEPVEVVEAVKPASFWKGAIMSFWSVSVIRRMRHTMRLHGMSCNAK